MVAGQAFQLTKEQNSSDIIYFIVNKQNSMISLIPKTVWSKLSHVIRFASDTFPGNLH